MEYRKDIDGLRAIAVLVVILFHYGFSLFPGGFIGVDIFFVISGYLITSIIVNDLEEEDFSFKKFYLRRARRILPALYTVLVISLLCAFIIFLPKDFLHFGKSLIATIVFVSNIMFMMDAGYFDTSALVKPLLHTWSLSVEEQFYLVFPVLLITLYKFLRSHFFNAILLLFFVTLALSEYVRDSNQIEAFFQSQSRAWEFLMGALLLHPKIRSLKKESVRKLSSIMGAILISFTVLTYNETTDFPGLSALIPCLGVALVIFSSAERLTCIGKAISSPPLVFIGLRSYSLYLWHWPVLIFATYTMSSPPGILQTAVLFSLTFALSIITYKFVELPFRHKKVLASDRLFFSALLVTSAFLLVIGGIILLAQGMPNRLAGVEIIEQQKKTVSGHCADMPLKDYGEKRCVLGVSKGRERFYVWGDSHAYAIAPAVDKAAKNLGKKGYLSATSGCPPLISADELDGTCKSQNENIVSRIKPGITVFLSARWNYYIKKSAINHEGAPTLAKNSEESLQELYQALSATISSIESKGGKAVIIRPEVEFYKDVPELLFLLHRAPLVHRNIVEDNNTDVNNIIDKLAKEHGVPTVNVIDTLCDKQICSGAEGNEPLYIDNDHLNEKGALKLAPLFRPFMK